MSHHKQCCILGICCDPAKQEEAVTHLIEESATTKDAVRDLLAVVDFVPKGVGAVIAKSYGPMFKTTNGDKGGPIDPNG